MDRPLPEGQAVHESLRLYVLCKGMRWTHLPNAGGLYDQHPKFLDDLHLIMAAESAAERVKAQREKNKQGKNKTAGRGGSRARRR